MPRILTLLHVHVHNYTSKISRSPSPRTPIYVYKLVERDSLEREITFIYHVRQLVDRFQYRREK